uniref:Dolichyl-diphosphooligosaccharide--protein glycosyltransferase subunit 4 n=2 Tax=Schizophyllum commune (strain H4-8 / FGSC 9210) TaxID=578458 RepID=D8Q856_SCHCM
MEHETLYSLANYLGTFAMLAVLGYHFVAVNGKYMAKDGKAKA